MICTRRSDELLIVSATQTYRYTDTKVRINEIYDESRELCLQKSCPWHRHSLAVDLAYMKLLVCFEALSVHVR